MPYNQLFKAVLFYLIVIIFIFTIYQTIYPKNGDYKNCSLQTKKIKG